jgi:F-type H+-transporting ATPase subunit a
VSKRLSILAAVFVTVGLLLVSIFVLKPAKPIIDIKGEKLVTIADLGNDAISISITNTLFTAWVAIVLLLAFCFFATRKKEMIPSGIYNFFEAILEGILSLVVNIAGEKHSRRFFPVIATFFLYITFANWLSLTPLFNTIGMFEPIGGEKAEFHSKALIMKDNGLIMPGTKVVDIDDTKCTTLTGEEAVQCRDTAIEEATAGKVKPGEKVGVIAPFLRGINTDLMTPLSFALVSAFFVEWWGISTLGFGTYMSKFFNFKGPIDFFVGILELIAEIARLISFSFRLFGNMMAGEILLLVMTFLVGITAPILIIFYGLEMFVGAIQAFVFGTLTLVFAVLAVSHHGPEESMHEGLEPHDHH